MANIKRFLTLIFISTLSALTMYSWGTSYISYIDDEEDTSTTISGTNVSSGTAGEISWTGTSCTYGSNRVNIAAGGSITFTASAGYVITKIVITSGSSADYYGTWTSSPAGGTPASANVATLQGFSSQSVTITTSTAFRCTSASTIKIYYTAGGGGGTSYDVTWVSNGTTHTTTSVNSGSKPTFPSTPTSCDATSTTFIGWTTAEWTGKINDGSAKVIYKTADAMPTVSADVTYYAVFAKGAVNTYMKGALSDLTNGQTVMIVNPTNNVALKSDKSGQSVTISSNTITLASAPLWTVEPSGSGYYFKTGTNYLNATSSGLQVTATQDVWVVSESGPYYLTSSNYNTRKLEYYNSSFTTYTGTGNNYKMDFYIPALEDYLTNCCSPYTITLVDGGTVTGGTFSASPSSACEDATVTLTATPSTGYQLASWSVYKTGDPSTTITVTNNQFTMPAYAVTVNATFETLVINIVLSNKSNGHVQSCVNEGSATVLYDGMALSSFTPVSRDGFNAPTGYWNAASGGVQVLNADGSFAAANVTGYITNGHWSSTTTPIELLARISCSDTIRLTTAGTDGSATLNRAKIPTCDCSDEARRVTITATPNTGYEATSISYSGDGTATKVSGPTASGSNTVWIYEFDQNDNGSGTFTITYSAIPSYTVTWNANGSESTTTVVKNNKPVFPSTPSACDATSTTFVGWATSTWSGKIENLAGKTVYTSADDMPAVTGPVTYYAVWAKGGGSGWTQTTSIAVDDEVVIAEIDEGTKELTGINTSGSTHYGDGVAFTTNPAGTMTWTVEEGNSTGTFAFKNSNDKYLYWSSGNSLDENATLSDKSSWTVSSIAEGTRVSLVNVNTNTRAIWWNGAGTGQRFACYEGKEHGSNNFYGIVFYKNGGGGYTDYITTCCTEVSRPDVSVAIHSTSVTLTWAKQGTATYTVTCPGGTIGSVTGDDTKSCTITGLTEETEYTYSVTVSGATCSQTATGSFTTSNCDDVPVVGSVVATAFAVRFSWTNTSNNTTIKLYSDEECNTLVRTKATTYTTTAKTDSIAGLTNGTTYYYKLFSDGTCPSAPGSFTTNENGINIAEWDTCAVYLDLGDMVSATAIVANQNTQAEITKHFADSLFFSKYFEADGTNKMIAIYNGTRDTLKLSNYRIDRSQKSSNSVLTYKLKLDDYGRIKPGYICPEEEIIIVKYSTGDASAEECLEAGDGHENWYNETANSTAPTGYTSPQAFLDFSGPMSIGLYSITANKYIDVIGATMSADGTGGLVQIESSNSSVCSYARYTTELNDKPGGFYQLDGDNYKTEATENNYFLSTNRCLLIRNNKVKSGLNSVARNVYDDSQMDCNEDIVKAFVTLSSSEEEWRGFQIGSGSAGSGETHSLTCQGMAEVGKFDYNDYYAKYDTILTGINLTDQRQEDGTYKIEISQLDTMSCTNLKIVVEDNNTHEKVSGTWKVPIFVTNDGGTGHDGNVKTNDEVFTKEGNDCASCDVVVLKDANLQVVTGGKNQVRNIEVYNDAKLYVPEGQTFTINQLVLRSKDDVIPRLDVRGTINQTADKFGFEKRIKATRWYKIALPYRCKISDVTFRNGEEATYGKDWVLRTYNGDRRANGTEGGNWDKYNGEYMEPGVGYNLAINADLLEPGNKYVELHFPMTPNAGFAEPVSINVPVVAYGANNSRTKDGEPVTPNHLGWNMIGNPYMMDYKTGTDGANMSQFIAGKLDIVDEKYQLTDNGLRYVVKLNENSKEYEQIAIGDGTKNIEPFLAYFVQIGGSSDNQGLNVQFVKGQQEGRSSIIRRNPAEYEEEDNHPVWCVINLTNVLDEQDETTFLISDDFTDDYDMMDDLVKMRGDKYTKYTKPVLASRNNAGEMAFNALPDQSAAAGIPLNYYAAADGDFTIALDGRFGIEELKDVQLYDSQEKKWIDLRMENNYPFYTTAGNNDSRFMLYVTVERKQPEVTTNIDNATSNLTLTTIDRTLIVSGLTSNSDIYVYDVSGKLLNTERHSSSVSGIFRTTVEDPGVYFVRVNGTDGQQTLRTIVY